MGTVHLPLDNRGDVDGALARLRVLLGALNDTPSDLHGHGFEARVYSHDDLSPSRLAVIQPGKAVVEMRHIARGE